MSATITTAELRAGLCPGVHLIDVRSGSEFATGHIPGAVNIPMDQIEARLDDLPANGRLVLVCQAGKRARITANLLEPCGRDVVVLEGGTDAWTQAGFPVVSNVKMRWSLERQVRLGAGVLVLSGVALALTIDSRWIYLSGFVGLGLTFAGLTDLCPMAIVLGKMPWNTQTHCKTTTSELKPDKGRS